jgi:predicted Zn-dependent peptidase
VAGRHGADRYDPETLARERLLGVALSPARTLPVANETLANITPDQLDSIFRDVYTPRKTTIAIVGGAGVFEALVEIQRRYADYGKPPSENASQPREARAAPAAARSAKSTGAPSKPGPATPDTEQSKPAETPAQSVAAGKLWYGNSRGDVGSSTVAIAFKADRVSSARPIGRRLKL